ncbi:CEP164 [Symbiodinium natans]|uniref:CEP164 protein n=1 Tax=Symbiodinium natans TaxID=878477 RepID=A0A812Q216_9DINO|nr:CEP164 [Symbiodinium natans]
MLQAPIRVYADARERATQGYGPRLPRGLDDTPEKGVVALHLASAGREAANGVYQATSKEKFGAPVYQNMRQPGFRILRDEQQNKGKVRHGWLLLSPEGEALYGLPTESATVPVCTWRCYQAEQPPPQIEAFQVLADAVNALVDALEVSVQTALAAEDWQLASSASTAALEDLCRSGQRFGDAFEGRAVRLLRCRAQASLGLRDWKAALRDAVVVLELSPGDAAEELAAAAATELGADPVELLEVIRGGGILDRCSPLSLRIVEQWVEDVVHVAEARASLRRRQEGMNTESEPLEDDGETGQPAAVAADHGRCIKPLSGSEVTDVYHRGFVAWAGFPRAEEMREPLFLHEWVLWLGSQLSILNWRLLARRKGVQLEDATPLSPRSQQRAAVEALVAAFEAAGRPAVEEPEAQDRPARCDAEAVLQQVSREVPSLRSR